MFEIKWMAISPYWLAGTEAEAEAEADTRGRQLTVGQKQLQRMQFLLQHIGLCTFVRFQWDKTGTCETSKSEPPVISQKLPFLLN